MCDEASKAYKRRKTEAEFASHWKIWLSGDGIDVGCGNNPVSPNMYPDIVSVIKYDTMFGSKDASYLPEVGDETLDFVHSSHCLEHLPDPYVALTSWLRVLKRKGFIVCTVPDETLYEHGFWPSRFNGDHKVSFTLSDTPKIPTAVNVYTLLNNFEDILLHRVCLIQDGFDRTLPDTIDQTGGDVECAIEFVIQKL